MQPSLWTENPRVSVILPTYDTAHLIGDCRESFLARASATSS
jgi:glycosyltransferase involved in cell wall biosynthesis